MKIKDNGKGTGFIANFKYEKGEPCGPTSYNGKHLGFLLESVIFHYLFNVSGGCAASSYYVSKDMKAICDVIMMCGNKPFGYLEIKSRRAIDGSFNPDYLVKEYKQSLSALQELNEPFALVVGQYQDEVNTVVKDLAYFDEAKGIYTSPPLDCAYEAAAEVANWYKFYLYVGHGEFGGWLDLSSEEKPLAQISDITDPLYAQCPLIEIAEGLSADAGMRNLEGDSVLSLQEYKRLYLPSANIKIEPEALEPEAPSPIEVLEAKIAKHRESARRHNQEAEDLNDSLLKATSNQIIEAVFSEMDSVSKHFESIEKSFLRIKTNYESLTSKVNGNFNLINEAKATLKVICQKVNKFETQTEDKIKAWVKVIAIWQDKVEDYKKSADTDINANKDNIDLLDDRIKELSEKVTNFECDLLLIKKSHLSNEKREHKNRELIDHLYSQLGEDQDG